MINPIALKLGPVSVHWYGIAYIVALGFGIWILNTLNKKQKAFKNSDQIFDYAFWIFLFGVIFGGRLGYILFYNLPYYIDKPLKIFAIWEGGMSFFGGIIGSAIVTYVYCKRHKIDFIKAGDIIVIPSALALFFTRIANFINRELIGRVIENHRWDWLGVDFGDGTLRYPSQLFQSLDALVLFLVLLFIYSRKPKKGTVLFSYLIFYGLLRFITEFWRAPDLQIGFILKYLTMGQILGFMMLLAGIIGLVLVRKRS
jgi:phosphatidylglycerol:prolipoprotein diacylglycerol transferase